MKLTAKTTLNQIIEMAAQDGYSISREQARAIKAADKKGCLAWSKQHIITTDDSRLSIFPGRA